MFLSNLRNVKDTSSPHTGIGSSKLHRADDRANDEVWCCAMTFYRIIVFSFRESDFNEMGSARYEYSEGGDEMHQWAQSASVSQQFQLVNQSRARPGEKYHQVIQMPLASIDRVEKTTEFAPSSAQSSFIAGSSLMGATSTVYADSLGGSVASGTLVIYGKDNGRCVQFTAPSYADCMGAYQALNTYAFPGRRNLGYLFAFESRRVEVVASVKNIDGDHGPNKNAVSRITSRATPRRYDALADFQRMISFSPDIQCPWRPLMKANATYNACQSYPSIVFGPSLINDETPEGMHIIREIAGFRSGQRFQTLAWASRHDGASIWRCAQPRVGLQGNRNVADEMYIKKIGECAALANSQAAVSGKLPRRPSIEFLRMLTGGTNASDLMLEAFGRDGAAFNEQCMVKIFDLRPKSSAMANRTAGKYI